MEYLTTQERLSGIAKKLGWGYILIHAHINLGTLDLLPDWLGYWFIYQAICLLEDEEESAGLLKPLGIGLMIWAGINWILKLVGGSVNMVLLNLVVSVVELYFHFQLLTNMANLAESYGCPQSGIFLTLRNIRTVLATVTAVFGYLLVSSRTEVLQWLAIAMGVVQLIVIVVLCYQLFQLSKAFLEIEIVEVDEDEENEEDRDCGESTEA